MTLLQVLLVLVVQTDAAGPPERARRVLTR
jgi:hypothetical protein